MTTNGKESMEEPSFRNANSREGFAILVNHPNVYCAPSNGPVSDEEEETLARQV